MKDKLELIDLAFGHAEVIEDFEKWCEENADRNPQYPVTEYIRAVDSRLGGKPRVDPNDERIKELVALTYELTSILPHARAVRDLLALHSADDIKAALKEYVPGLDEKDMKSAIRSFYDDLGASAIIYAREKRK